MFEAQVQSFKGQSARTKIRGQRTCGHRSRAAAAPAAVEPAAEPAPPVAAPVEVANVEVAARVAVDRSPEEDVLAFPFLGYEVGIGEEVIKDVGVEDGLVRNFLAELVALNRLATVLPFREVQRDLRGVPFELAALSVLLDFPTVRNERIGIKVNINFFYILHTFYG